MIEIVDEGRIRTITFQRPDAKNAMNTAMWDGTTEAFLSAADDPAVAVVVLTGSDDSFSAGQDLLEMAAMATGNGPEQTHGFAGLCRTLIDFPKPLILGVNGLGLGFGVTILGLADLVFAADTARFKCPFTGLGVAPELASSVSFPRLIGRQNASWVLMSSEWISAEQAHEMGLVFRVSQADTLMDETMAAARTLAAKPISSLVETKATIVEPMRAALHAAHERENAAFAKLMGGPANIEAMTAFAEKRQPNFDGID
ncbi:MAG: enoyl-CoA hydratase-related protein [Acidimicrobiales bacterium]|nr:enoyl-CoA hydratase-related protein [Acidimicrobiales bacterium]